MSHVNRSDRVSRRLLGVLGRLDAVENMVKGSPKVCEVEAQNRALTERVAALEIGHGAFVKMLATYQEALVQAREQIDALKQPVVAESVQTETVPS